MTVITPAMSHTTSSQPGAPTWRAMSAETMKMPEPIIEPATTAVASHSPRPRTNPPVADRLSLMVLSASCDTRFATCHKRAFSAGAQAAPALGAGTEFANRL